MISIDSNSPVPVVAEKLKANGNMKKVALVSLSTSSVLLTMLGLLGIYQAIFLFGSGPNFSQDRFTSNLTIYSVVTVLGLGVLVYAVRRLRRGGLS